MSLSKKQKQEIIEKAIQYIIESDLTGYRISKDTGIAEASISHYRKGGRPSYNTSKTIIDYFEKLQLEKTNILNNSALSYGGTAIKGNNHVTNNLTISTPKPGELKIIKPDGTVEIRDEALDEKAQRMAEDFKDKIQNLEERLQLREEKLRFMEERLNFKEEVIINLKDEISRMRDIHN